MQILAHENIRGSTLGQELRRRNYPRTRALESWELSPWDGRKLLRSFLSRGRPYPETPASATRNSVCIKLFTFHVITAMMPLLLALGQPVSAHRLGSAQLGFALKICLKKWYLVIDLYVLSTTHFIFFNTCCTFVFVYQILVYTCFINAKILLKK